MAVSSLQALVRVGKAWEEVSPEPRAVIVEFNQARKEIVVFAPPAVLSSLQRDEPQLVAKLHDALYRPVAAARDPLIKSISFVGADDQILLLARKLAEMRSLLHEQI